MNGVTDGGPSSTSESGGSRASTSPSMQERERRLKARMAELADKNRSTDDGGGGTSPSSAAAPAPAPRSLASSLGSSGAGSSSAPGVGLSRYTATSLDKGSYSSYRYSGFTSRLKSYDAANGPTSCPSSTAAAASSATDSASTTPSSTLSSKRELFFRDGPTVLSSATANGTTASLRDQDDGSRLGSANTTMKDKLSGGSTGTATKEVDGYVGFANLPNQVYRKAVKRGFEFTLMVVGESGLGKSTLINSMFLSDIYSNEYPGPSQRIKKTVQVETTKVLLKENGVNLQLTVVDTPGFGDAVDNSNCWQPVTDYIENQYEDYLNAESRVNRRSMPDNRVHCCVYFIAPSGHGLKPLDVEFMKRLQDKVNIIPIIAKADTMTPEECVLFKKTIMNEIAQNKIKIYEFPDCDDEEENKNQKPLKDRVPFAVVGSNVMVDSNGKKVRGRRYPWGVAEVENLEHCDFIALRNMLIRTHMQDLKDITNIVHYENYRCRRLAGVGNDGKPLRVSNKNPLAQMEEEKRDHENKMKKMELDMEQVFEMKVKEKKQKLKDSEADLQRRHEQMKKNLEQQQKELEEKRKAFDKEKTSWEDVNKVTLDELRRRSLESNSKEQVEGKEKKKEKKKGLF